MLKLYGKKNKKLTVDLSTVNELKENDKILIASNGKMKQIDQELVNIGGGGSAPDGPTFNDGKTRLFVTVASMDRPVIAIYFGCTVAGGVTIDWGDGSETEATTSTERTRYSHSYSAAGDYIIALEVTDGELVLEGDGYFGIMTQNYDNPEPPYSLSYVITALKRVEIGDGITSIGECAFNGCSALTSVVIPSSVTSIGKSAFGNCGLTSVTIQEGVTNIGKGAFEGCKLTSVTIPEGVTIIENNAFSTCNFLTYVTIQEGVTSIEAGTFAVCSSLTSVTIPSSVTSIGNNVFVSCSSLGGVHLLSPTPPTLSNSAFSNLPSDCKFYIPAGSLAAYSSASNWSNYVSMMVEE